MSQDKQQDIRKKYAHLDIPENLPTHVAVIMDGNRRWSVERDIPYTDGHKEALVKMEEIIEFSILAKITHLTFWAWSTKNWKRNKDFIDGIITLFRAQLKEESIFDRAVRNGVKLHHIGKWDGFPGDVVKGVTEKLKVDPKEKKINVNLAVGYDGRDEIVRAVKKIIKEGVSADEITQETIASHLDTAGQPDVDLMIRTGGDFRTSGYLIWQIANAEMYFTKTYMPDFTPDKFNEALTNYSTRERRMGGDSKKY